MGELLINLFHPLNVESAALCMVDHRFGVIHSYHTVGCLLERLRCIPRLVDVPVRVVLQDGDVTPVGRFKKDLNISTSIVLTADIQMHIQSVYS